MGKTLMLLLGIIFLVLVLATPSGVTAWFDGLPWVNGSETLTLSVIVPFLLALGWRFLFLRITILSLVALFSLKIILFVGSPVGGWLVKLYPNVTPEQVSRQIFFKKPDGDSWIRTYATSWNPQASGVLKKPWTEKLDFPLDWFLPSLSCKDTENKLITMATEANPKYCFDDLKPILEINGAVFLPKGNRFSIVAEGVQEGSLYATNDSGESFVLLPAKNSNEAGLKQYQLPKDGLWQIAGKLTYKGVNWSLIPTLISDEGETTSDLGRDILWQDGPELTEKKNMIWFYKMLSHFIDFGISFFLLVWAIWTARGLVKEQVLTLPLAFFSLLAVFISSVVGPIVKSILRGVNLSDPTNISHLGVSIIIVSMGLIFWVVWKRDSRNFQPERITKSVFLFYGVAMFPFFSHIWRHTLGKMTLWSPGDDWASYQGFARKIVVEGEWLNAGEGVFIMQPLYRYFVGIYHLLFGQSPFVQYMADVWCVLGATTLIASLAMKLRISTLVVFVGSIVYLTTNLMGGFRYHIGRGLIEQHSMIFMILAVWLLYGSREENFLRTIGAGICGVIGYWLRQDHLIVISLLVFLIIEPTYGSVREVWRSYWQQVQTYWKRGFTYFGIISFGFLLMCFRNWWVGDVFGPSVKNHVILEGFDIHAFYLRMRLMLTASHDTPSLATLILLPGVLFGLLALIWRPKFLKAYPLAFGWAFIGIFLPYVFFGNPGYAPRKSIHLLPMALLSTMIIFNYYSIKIPFLKDHIDKK